MKLNDFLVAAVIINGRHFDHGDSLWKSTIQNMVITTADKGRKNNCDLYLTNITDPPVLPTVNFEEVAYVVDEGNTVTVNVVRGDDGGVVPINVGE